MTEKKLAEDLHTVVFDLETKRDFKSVGGRSYISDLQMSVGVLWDSLQEDFLVFEEKQIEDLIEHLQKAEMIVGFNHLFFDFEVLSGYRSRHQRTEFMQNLKSLNNLDLMLDIKNLTGHRVSLASLVMPTLNAKKLGSGLDALEWYDKYLTTNDYAYMEKIIKYCKKDVELTKELYYTGLKHKKILHETKNGDLRWIKVDWQKFSSTEFKDKNTESSFLKQESLF